MFKGKESPVVYRRDGQLDRVPFSHRRGVLNTAIFVVSS